MSKGEVSWVLESVVEVMSTAWEKVGVIEPA